MTKVSIDTIKKLNIFLKNNKKDLLQEKQILLLFGEIGVGKTTLVRHLLSENEEVCSPTFSLINNYSIDGLKVYHIDLYRLESLDDLESSGFYDIFEEKALVIIEWADKISRQNLPYGWKTIELRLNNAIDGRFVEVNICQDL